MKITIVLAIISITVAIGIGFTFSAAPSVFAHSFDFCHNEKSGTNFLGKCPGQSEEHNKNLEEGKCVIDGRHNTCPDNLQERGQASQGEHL
jgi:hypothetical protein